MAEVATPAPVTLTPLAGIALGALPEAGDLGLAVDSCPGRQVGGCAAALHLLDTFLDTRSETYRTAMSSPLTGEAACSRLSPHLAWGTVAMREVAQATWARQRALKRMEGTRVRRLAGAMTSFGGRLHWRSHFMQKLEDEPRLEFENLHRAYDGVRNAGNATHLAAWAAGETGLPFVDACMRSLRATGWINFRMRAMLMAVASYHLWLDWRASGLHLARLFVDYEPGIHWPQCQMQAGTTGINAVRIYNPVKQGQDQDPAGVFIRRFMPELDAVPDAHLHMPWRWDGAGGFLGVRYPWPIVDHLTAARSARQKIWAVRGGAAFRAEAMRIQDKHGSRKSGMPMTGRAPRVTKHTPGQLSFDLAMPRAQRAKSVRSNLKLP